MIMTPTKAREVGEALIDAAENAQTTGKTQYVKWDDDLNTAFSVPSVIGVYELICVVEAV